MRQPGSCAASPTARPGPVLPARHCDTIIKTSNYDYDLQCHQIAGRQAAARTLVSPARLPCPSPPRPSAALPAAPSFSQVFPSLVQKITLSGRAATYQARSTKHSSAGRLAVLLPPFDLQVLAVTLGALSLALL